MSTLFTPEFYNILSSSVTTGNTLYMYVSDNRDVTSLPGSPKYFNEVLSRTVWGKKIQTANIFSMIRRIDWETGKIFAMYDDLDSEIMNKDFYCLNTNRAVYKCLNNNGGVPSTQEPTSFDMVPFSTSDGYVWKYMYRLTVEELADRSFLNFIPCLNEASVVNTAIPGTIDSVIIDIPGVYPAVNKGFVVSKVSNWIFRIQDTGSGLEDYYKDSAFYIEAGPSTGSKEVIERYYSNTSGRYVQLKAPMPNVTNVSKYSITPDIQILGDGINAKARPIMNNDNSIRSVEIISRGSNYSYADIQVETSDYAQTIPASIRPIVSSLKGHGHNAKKELGAASLLFSLDVNGNEASTILTPSIFNNYGIVKDVRKVSDGTPYTATTFDNLVLIETLAINGEFEVGEIVRLDSNENVRAKILSKTAGPNYKMLYEGRYFFSENQTIQNETGTLAFIRVITTTDADLTKADILSFDQTTLLTHNTGEKTTFNIMIATIPE